MKHEQVVFYARQQVKTISSITQPKPSPRSRKQRTEICHDVYGVRINIVLLHFVLSQTHLPRNVPS